jgi:predicted Zn-dependent protease
MVILELQGEGDDPEAAAREYAEKVDVELEGGEARRINGNPSYRARTGLDLEGSKVKADVTWIAFGGKVYRIMGVVEARRLTPDADFSRVARSFRPLSASERDAMRVTRLRVARKLPDEDLDALSLRTRNAWSRDETTVMNGLSVDDPLPAGEPVKVAVPEPWTPGD